METANFFEFCSKHFSSTFQAYPIGLDSNPRENGIFDHRRLIMGDYEGIHFPVIFKQKYGKKMHDILDTGHFGLYLISDRFSCLLKENKLTGWETFFIKLLDKKENEITGYNGLSIVGRCGLIDYSKSEIIYKQFFENGPRYKYFKGYHFQLDHWDRSDFFLPKGSIGAIITEKAAVVLKNNKISNVALQNLVEVEVSEDIAMSAEQKKFE